MCWPAFVFLAMWLASGTACALTVPELEPKEKTRSGTKFHPGHYVMTSISRAYLPEERSRRRLAFIKDHLDNEQIRGFMSHFEWKVLEPERGRYNLKPIADILESLEGSDKHLAIYLRDRNFSRNCNKAPVPKYLLKPEFGQPYKHRITCMVELYNPRVVDRKIALYKAIAARFDSHPNLEMITDGETAIGGSADYSHERWAAEIQRFFIEVKRHFRHTMVLIQMNFLGDGTRLLSKVAKTIESTGGGALGLPDTVPCRRRDIPESAVCEYTIPGYDVLRDFQGRVAIAPTADTWDLRIDEAASVYDMALDYLGADHVFWSRRFTSRRDTYPEEPDSYFDREILPLLKERGSDIASKCPSSLAPCIMQHD